MEQFTTLLIIGAGPFGLAMAAHAQHLGIDYIVAGRPMEFWKMNMPDGMYLRSSCDWHLDTTGEHTIDAFLQIQQSNCKKVEPLSRQFYLSYVQWFINEKKINCLPSYIKRLDYANDGYTAVTDDGITIHAKFVVVAIGLKYFKNLPIEIINQLPAGSFSHTCDLVDMRSMKINVFYQSVEDKALLSGLHYCMKQEQKPYIFLTGTVPRHLLLLTCRG